MGVISAIGNSVAENHSALVQGKTGIRNKMNLFPSKYACSLPFAQVQQSTASLQESLQIKIPGVTRTSLLALHAFKECISNGNLSDAEISRSDIALIGASTVGGMCLTDELYADANKNKHGSAFTSSYDCASVNLFLQEHYKMAGIINTINTACSSSANAIMYGAMLLKNGLAKRAIVGGADSLAKFTINGFNALHILSAELCSPFDENRKGLNLGEAAAFLLLEREEDVTGKKIYAELTGYCNANDAFHPSSLSVEADGPFLAMQGAIQKANLTNNQIDFINAHGTGTENNDEAESKAMIRLFNQPPAFASSKGNIGHTLGAAGAIEAVYSILSLLHQEAYANLQFKDPIASTSLVPVQQYQKMKINNIMSNSFGFGGNCSSLIFSKFFN